MVLNDYFKDSCGGEVVSHFFPDFPANLDSEEVLYGIKGANAKDLISLGRTKRVYDTVSSSDCHKIALTGCDRFDDKESDPFILFHNILKCTNNFDKPNALIICQDVVNVLIKRGITLDALKKEFNIPNIYIEDTAYITGSYVTSNEVFSLMFKGKMLFLSADKNNIDNNFVVILYDENKPVYEESGAVYAKYKVVVKNPNKGYLVTHCINN